jgi:hypothetical protein
MQKYMNLFLNSALAVAYKSNTQIARVLTESWVAQNGYCPNCASSSITQHRNNAPVRDFFCPYCAEQFELKSKNGHKIGAKVNDGAYETMMQRIQADDSPNFLFLSYRKADYAVQQLVLVPRHFINPDMIVRRKPLPVTAKRAGWVGCVMNMAMLPTSGKILLIDKAQAIPPQQVRQQWQQTLFLRHQKATRKGWLLAIMRCVERLPEQFTLAQIYQFETQLQLQFPDNKHIKDKIRQQLQVLRDQQVIEFVGRGQYRKIEIV